MAGGLRGVKASTGTLSPKKLKRENFSHLSRRLHRFMPTTIHAVLEEFREAACSKRDLGDKFERLIANYLMTDPQYADRLARVWLWHE